MATRKQALDRNQLALERAETRAARDLARAYNQARRELVADLLDAWPGQIVTPEEAVAAARQFGILQRIDARLLQLERETGVVLRDVIDSASERAVDAIGRDLAVLPRTVTQALRPFTAINTAMIERFLPIALDEASLARGALTGQLRRELQAGLIQGESFPDLVGRLMRVSEPSVWRNGQVSAERAVRRLVVTSENTARGEAIRQAQEQIPAVRRQAVAAIGSNTTQTCLHVHGQIVDVDEPFDLRGYEPQFAREMMHPAFHWNCRTAVAMWHPRFESGGLTTANMQSSAQAELRKRRNAA